MTVKDVFLNVFYYDSCMLRPTDQETTVIEKIVAFHSSQEKRGCYVGDTWGSTGIGQGSERTRRKHGQEP